MDPDIGNDKQRLHRMVDRLAPEQLHALRALVEVMLDPVSRAIDSAAVDDEPIAPEERRALAEATQWLKEREPISHEQVLAELGITREEIDGYKGPA